MNRWLLVLLAVLLPLQLALASVAHACDAAHHAPASEQVQAHDHDHEHEPSVSLDGESSLSCDHHCHHVTAFAATLGGPSAAMAPQQVAPAHCTGAASSLPSRPERPKWISLA
jgi:heme A synthase